MQRSQWCHLTSDEFAHLTVQSYERLLKFERNKCGTDLCRSTEVGVGHMRRPSPARASTDDASDLEDYELVEEDTEGADPPLALDSMSVSLRYVVGEKVTTTCLSTIRTGDETEYSILCTSIPT